MLKKFQEVYLKTAKSSEDRPDGLTRVVTRKLYFSRECLINPDYIVAVYGHEFSSSADLQMTDGQFPQGTQYCRLILDGNSFRSSEIIVIGSFTKIAQSLK